ncbi:hypothetical protein ACROYT_G044671 [Oculina patagonica]
MEGQWLNKQKRTEHLRRIENHHFQISCLLRKKARRHYVQEVQRSMNCWRSPCGLIVYHTPRIHYALISTSDSCGQKQPCCYAKRQREVSPDSLNTVVHNKVVDIRVKQRKVPLK